MSHLDRKEIQRQLADRGIDVEHIRSLHIKLQSGELDHTSFVIPESSLQAPTADDVVFEDKISANNKELGVNALEQDQLAVFWLNGGAATRYFDLSKVTADEMEQYGDELKQMAAEWSNAPKGVTPTIQHYSYLELKVRNLLQVKHDYNLANHPQVILMNSFITDTKTREHLQELFEKYPELESDRFHYIIQQPTIPRFNKVDDLKNIDLFVDNNDTLSFAPCGHGDFIALLQEYLKATTLPHVQYIFFTNIDNIGATVNPLLLGAHITSQKGRTVELAEKYPGDKGGAPAFVDGELMIVEQMKFPESFDQSSIAWFNTNNFWFTLSDLVNFSEDLPLVLAEKTLEEGDVYQLEHFACDVHLPTQYVVVDRERRFWPIKRYVDLLLHQNSHHDPKKFAALQELMHEAYTIELPE